MEEYCPDWHVVPQAAYRPRALRRATKHSESCTESTSLVFWPQPPRQVPSRRVSTTILRLRTSFSVARSSPSNTLQNLATAASGPTNVNSSRSSRCVLFRKTVRCTSACPSWIARRPVHTAPVHSTHRPSSWNKALKRAMSWVFHADSHWLMIASICWRSVARSVRACCAVAGLVRRNTAAVQKTTVFSRWRSVRVMRRSPWWPPNGPDEPLAVATCSHRPFGAWLHLDVRPCRPVQRVSLIVSSRMSQLRSHQRQA